MLIELHDAATGTLVDEFGPRESAELAVLPLEDTTRDLWSGVSLATATSSTDVVREMDATLTRLETLLKGV